MSNDRLKQKARAYAAEHGISYVEARRILLARDELPAGITWVEDPRHPGTIRAFTIQQQVRTSDDTLPFEILVDERGFVRNQKLWKGNPFRIVGFVDDPASYDITLLPDSWYDDPQAAVGKHPVFHDREGQYGTWRGAIETVEVGRVPATDAHAVTATARLTDSDRTLVIGIGHLLIHLADREILALRAAAWSARNDAANDILALLAFDDDDQPFDTRPWEDLLDGYIENQAWADLDLQLHYGEAEAWLAANRPDLARA